MIRSRASRRLGETFGRADPEHYRMQTTGTIGAAERALVRAAFLPVGRQVLDVGCGEGATFRHLGLSRGAIGVDLFADKLCFARSKLPDCEFVVGSAYELPFGRQLFDHVLARDLVHHLDDPARFVAECYRVLRPGGRLDLLEPSRYNPIVLAHGLSIRSERGELGSSARRLERMLAGSFRIDRVRRYQALPLHRLVFHPRYGWPTLADSDGARRFVARLERTAEHLLPTVLFAYVHMRAIRR